MGISVKFKEKSKKLFAFQKAFSKKVKSKRKGGIKLFMSKKKKKEEKYKRGSKIGKIFFKNSTDIPK